MDKIHEFQATLKDPARSVEDRRFALRFLIHCVQDLHMPMHVGDNHDKGGNQTQVRFYDRGTNMHRALGFRHDRASRGRRRILDGRSCLAGHRENREAAMKGSVEDWATESLLAARAAYQVPETGKRLKAWAEALGCVLQRESACRIAATLSGQHPGHSSPIPTAGWRSKSFDFPLEGGHTGRLRHIFACLWWGRERTRTLSHTPGGLWR